MYRRAVSAIIMLTFRVARFMCFHLRKESGEQRRVHWQAHCWARRVPKPKWPSSEGFSVRCGGRRTLCKAELILHLLCSTGKSVNTLAKDGYSQFFFLKKSSIDAANNAIPKRIRGYPHRHSSSGIYRKFMPLTPAIKVRGMKIVAMIVNTFMMELVLLLTLER